MTQSELRLLDKRLSRQTLEASTLLLLASLPTGFTTFSTETRITPRSVHLCCRECVRRVRRGRRVQVEGGRQDLREGKQGPIDHRHRGAPGLRRMRECSDARSREDAVCRRTHGEETLFHLQWHRQFQQQEVLRSIESEGLGGRMTTLAAPEPAPEERKDH